MARDHSHSNNQSGKNLKIAFFLNLSFTILEFIGGMYVNSIAIRRGTRLRRQSVAKIS